MTIQSDEQARAMEGLAPDLMTAESREWLIQQLARWPERVNPEFTTNVTFLMGSAARLIEYQATALAKRDAEIAACMEIVEYVAGKGTISEMMDRPIPSGAQAEVHDLIAAMGARRAEADAMVVKARAILTNSGDKTDD